MSEFVIRRFQWDRRGEASPPSPFPKDFRSLCSDFDLAMVEQAAAYYELPELPQVIFYAMLHNEAEKLGVLHGSRLRSLEVALTELRWGAFESWIWLFGGAFSDPAAMMAFPPTDRTREMANYARETFTWHRRSALRPPRPLPEDFDVLCPYFSLAEAEAAAAESGLPEIVQATFYAMLLSDMLELGAVHKYTAEKMRSVLVDLGWSAFEAWMRIMDPVIRGAQLYRQPDEVEFKEARSDQGESLGSADRPVPSSDEE
ncbi:hypothetical protein Cgig2_000617 [Carnegiea gigantea]|uniref:Uncharacterized protein n=1 Tax=Carnegiea gigantea TaxID=171969 RepID=A0A9Q1GIT8_9CARY|nr:hypothetical protein Cgig2_000617 [Carnegiea gigantea]